MSAIVSLLQDEDTLLAKKTKKINEYAANKKKYLEDIILHKGGVRSFEDYQYYVGYYEGFNDMWSYLTSREKEENEQ